MMKIKSLETENTYILPLDALVNIVVTSNYKEDLIQCLTNLCMAKKKNKALLLSDKNEIINFLINRWITWILLQVWIRIQCST